MNSIFKKTTQKISYISGEEKISQKQVGLSKVARFISLSRFSQSNVGDWKWLNSQYKIRGHKMFLVGIDKRGGYSELCMSVRKWKWKYKVV